MIIRVSQKLGTKIKAGSLTTVPLDENPFADWSAHLFVADRTQYILLSNTKSLYSTVMYGQEITNDSRFIERAMSNLREFMADDGQQFIYRRFIAPATTSVRFAKALNRTVTGSMNELIIHATAMLVGIGTITLELFAFSRLGIPWNPLVLVVAGLPLVAFAM